MLFDVVGHFVHLSSISGTALCPELKVEHILTKTARAEFVIWTGQRGNHPYSNTCNVHSSRDEYQNMTFIVQSVIVSVDPL